MTDNKQLQQFIDRSDVAVLPVLHNTLQVLKAALAKPNFNYHQLDSILQYDPACMINLLSYANQEVNKDFDKEISKVEHAAMFLGMDRLENFIQNITSIKSLKNKKIADKINQLQYRGIHAAFQAQNFAQLINESSVNEIYTSALVTPLSELICWNLEPIKTQKVELLIHKENKDYEQAQIEIFGFSYHELAEALTHQWNIPTLFLQRQEVDTLEEMSKSVKCIYLAEKCSIISETGWYHDNMYDYISSCTENLHYGEARIAQELHKTAINLAHSTKDFFKIQSVSSYLALLPGVVPYTQVIEIEDKKKPVVQPEVKKPAAPKPVAKTVDSINLIKTVNDFPSLIRITMDALFETKAFTRVAFIMLSKDKKLLKVRSFRGNQTKTFIETSLSVEPANLFSKLLTKPQSVLINQQNYQKFAIMINETMRTMLDSQEFVAKSIHSKDKPIGLFYMDKHPIDNEPDSIQSINADDIDKMKAVFSIFEQHLKRMN